MLKLVNNKWAKEEKRREREKMKKRKRRKERGKGRGEGDRGQRRSGTDPTVLDNRCSGTHTPHMHIQFHLGAVSSLKLH